MNLGTIAHMLSLDGLPLIDAAAAATGHSQVPSQIARPLLSVRPETLDSIQGKWASSAAHLEDGMEDLRLTVASVLSDWNTPESFQTYTSKMHEVLDKQKAAMQELDSVVQNLKNALTAAKKEAKSSVSETETAIRNMIIGATIGIFTGSVTGVLIGILVGLVSAFIAKNAAIDKMIHNEVQAADGAIKKLKEIISGERLKEITPPPPPSIKWSGYHSIHELS